MIIGTTIRVFVMTILLLPIGVITAIYLTEYAPTGSIVTRIIRAAVNNLAGVRPSSLGCLVFGFFINFLGRHMDELLQIPAPSGANPPCCGRR